MSSVEERLERRIQTLEIRDRRWKRWGLAVAGAAGVALLMGQAATKELVKMRAKTVEAEKFVILDAAGKTRVEIAVDKNGSGIAFLDGRGKTRVVLGEGTIEGLDERSGLWVFDEKERPRLVVGIGKSGSGLFVLDEKGHPVAGRGNPDPTVFTRFSRRTHSGDTEPH